MSEHKHSFSSRTSRGVATILLHLHPLNMVVNLAMALAAGLVRWQTACLLLPVIAHLLGYWYLRRCEKGNARPSAEYY